ncbi:MAG: hypothetical protein OJI74_16375 [Rhodanobacter thiooxydans]|nr:hypothetical protein [Rhodanobacter thiooxydans]
MEAIAEKTQQAELRADFDALAEQRYASIVLPGKAIGDDFDCRELTRTRQHKGLQSI